MNDGKFMLEHLKRMDHLDQAGFNTHASMTAILPMAQTVYTGDEDGKVVRSVTFPSWRRIQSTDLKMLVRVGLYQKTVTQIPVKQGI